MSGILIIGAGAFGTALAVALSRDGTPVTLIARDAQTAQDLNLSRENTRHLPGIAFPEALRISAEPDTNMPETVLLAVPMQALSSVVGAHAGLLARRALVACCKGIDLDTRQGPTAILQSACPNAKVAVLTGPSFAVDIGTGLPTALTLACGDPGVGRSLQEQLSRLALRIYLSTDVIGAELGGALKNVVAIAAGLAMGAGLGESARASVVTRGFAEMRRIASDLGAKPDTLSGLSGLGDLVLTCTSDKSRNYSAGMSLGAGKTLPEGRTIEGIATTRAMAGLAQSRGIDAPLTSTIAAVLNGDMTITEARESLLTRPLRAE